MMKFTERTAAPERDNRFYFKDNPYYKNGFGMANCTCYACGRFAEIRGAFANIAYGNAEDWYNNTTEFSKGTVPKVGAIICWRKGKIGNQSDGAGHVAIVERVNSDGSIICSASNHKGTFWYRSTYKAPNFYIGNAYSFQGFIYNDINIEDDGEKTMGKIMGIDVSRWQGNIDWEKVKSSGVRFAIIRAGYGSSASQKDTSFERNYAECKRLGIPVGAYWYSYATNTTAATMEAQAFLEVIKGKSFEYPIWFDQEYEPSIKALNNAQRTAIVKAALTALENAGYYAGLYASANWINCWLNYTELARFDVWAAQYGSACSAKLPFGMWQYLGGGGTCAGISGACDRDYAYKDYPAIIKGAGLNGFTKADTAHPAGDGNDDGTAAKEPESEQPTESPAVKLYTLKIGPMSVGDKNTLEASAKALGIPVAEVE